MEQAVYITGSGIVSSIGIGKQQTLNSLLNGESGITTLRYLETIHKHLPAGEVKLSDDQMRRMLKLDAAFEANRTSLIGSLALVETLDDAGLSPDQCIDAWLISGTTVGGMGYTERHYLDMLQNDEYLNLLRTHACGATTQITAQAAGIGNVRMITPSTACSSAANAIVMGCNLIKTGRADVVIAGGSESLSKFHFNGFNTLRILDSERCKPFDEMRAGLNLGEGAAYLVLESESSVKKRGVVPRFQIDGYGNACDAFHQTASSDNGDGAYFAMHQAMEMAGLKAEEIQYVNAHGTGTQNNDISEGNALLRIFGQTMPPVSSTKSYTGHTTSASGSIEAVICLLAMKHRFIPPNLGWKNQIPGGITPSVGCYGIDLTHVMCNSFGFGGNDTSIILSKADNLAHVGGKSYNTKIFIKSICIHRPEDGKVDVSGFIGKMEARRMCSLLKTAIFTSLSALKEADIEKPDGIITATWYGMLENSEIFLDQMCRYGEELLKPTLFMQSTHNTIGGLLGAMLKCHGYNITFSNGADSLRDALLDARLQLELGRAKNILVGYHNELTPCFADMERRLYGRNSNPGGTSIVLVLSTDPADSKMELDDFEMSKIL